MEILEQPQADFFEQHQSTHALEVPISCTTCNTSFSPSSTNTNLCIKCISTQTDISIGITKQAVLNFCRTCKRYLSPPWVPAELESKDLLAICLRRVRGLNKVKLLDASFIWTEPHSRRIKIKLTVQKEVLNGVTVQQTFPIEFVVYHQQCEDCKKESTPQNWGALVQVRQKADHKKTFYFLEQLILKYNAHDKVLNIKELPEGVDFFYKDRSHAQRLVDFLQTMLAVRVKQSKQLISQDLVSNTCHYKYTFSVDLPRICKDDLVILPLRVAAAFGGCSSVLVCAKVATMIRFIDPITMRTIEISGADYFKYEDDMSFIPCKGFATEFFVFDIEPCDTSNKVKTVRASIARVSDYQNFDVKTSLGDVLKVGSSVLGYDLSSLNLSGHIDDNVTLKSLPEVILVKKSYPKHLRKRIWKLKQLEKDDEEADIILDNDYEEFLNDLEADPEMRSHVNLYRNEKAIREKETDQMVDENEPQKGSKKKLKIKRRSNNRQPLAAAGGKENEGNDDGDDDKDQDENRDSNAKEIKKKEDVKQQEGKDEDDALVRIEELLADLTLEDQIVEDNDDAIEEFIRRLENVRIEGKE